MGDVAIMKSYAENHKAKFAEIDASMFDTISSNTQSLQILVVETIDLLCLLVDYPGSPITLCSHTNKRHNVQI